ncbi:unnamed protein product [Allacma fusca]|uniref:Uncharacterized protein n=1 Tax=Allacma fusca TaxID=39272 RepID=A0A8J2K1D1_9HEXA|nr:unnamed protein product [Allacma fusca]
MCEYFATERKMSHQQNFWSINGSFLGNIVESTMEVDAFISNGERATRQGDQNYIKALELGNQRLNGKLIRALCENRNLSVIMETLLELHPFELIDIVQLLQKTIRDIELSTSNLRIFLIRGMVRAGKKTSILIDNLDYLDLFLVLDCNFDVGVDRLDG